MPTPMQKFVPTVDELNLANRLLETTTGSWNRSDSLSVDAAIGIFKQSGISFKQIRDIWSIADKDSSGKLTKEELAVVIRLTGWVQAGEDLNESLLEKEGPLPKIKGIVDVVPPKIVPLFPLITDDDVAKLKQTFLDCNPINGVLPKRNVMAAYMDSKPDLSFEALFRVMQLVDSQNGPLDFKNFAIGLHIVRNLHSSLISSVPLSIPAEAYSILDDVILGGKSPSTNEGSHEIGQGRTQSNIVGIPTQADFDIFDFMEDLKIQKHISGKMALDFSSKHNINPAEMAQIWRQSDVGVKHELSPARITLIEQLIRIRMAKQASVDESLFVAPRLPPKPPVDNSPLFSRTVNLHSGLEHDGEIRALKSEPSSTLAVTSHIHSPLHQPPSYDLSTSLHEDFFGKFKQEIGRLTSQLEAVVLDQTWTQKEVRSNLDTLQHENVQLRLQQQTMQDQLAKKEEVLASEKLTELIKLELLEQQVISKEYQEAAININKEADRLWGTVETQSRQITTLLELVDMKTAITELNLKPEQHDLRLRFLRATIRESEAAVTKAVTEAQELRQTVLDQEQEIVELRKRLEDVENVQPVCHVDNDIQTLRNDHEELTTGIENMQRLMEHLANSSVRTDTIHDQDTLVPIHRPSTHKRQERSSPSDSLRHIATDPLEQFHLTQSPPPISFSSAHQIPPSYFSCSTIPDTKVEPFHVSRKTSTASNLIQLSSLEVETPIRIKVDEQPQYMAQLEDDLHLFKLHVRRKGYIGIEMVKRFISNYDLDAFSLDEIGRLAGLDASVKRINHAVDLIRQAVMSPRSLDKPLALSSLSRSSSSTSTKSNTMSSHFSQASYSKTSSRIDRNSPALLRAPIVPSLPLHHSKAIPSTDF